MTKFIENNKLFLICIILFIIITLPIMLSHHPISDEAQNFMVSYFLTPQNFAELISTNGHPAIWYLVMLPFAKYNICYPYSILIINYLFILSAIIIMWKNAPFDNIFKIIITFAYMNVSYFAVYARCYSIGILGLFLLASLYKTKYKKPLLYAFLLGMTANTSAMAAIPTIALASIFSYGLFFTEKELPAIKKIMSCVILILFAFVFLFPFIKYSVFSYSNEEIKYFILGMKNFFFPIKENFTFLISFLFVLYYLIFCSKDKTSKFFLLCSTILFMLFIAFIYKCFYYHRLFLLIFIIITIWLQNYTEKYTKLITVLVFSLTVIFYTPSHLNYWNGDKNIFDFGKLLKTDKLKYGNSVVVIPDYFFRYEIAPFLILNIPDIKIFGCTQYYDYRFLDGNNCDYNNKNIKELISTTKQDIYMFSKNKINNYIPTETYKDIYIYKLK